MSQECHTLHRLLAFENFRDASGSQALKKDECLSVLTECCSSYITPNLLPSLSFNFPFLLAFENSYQNIISSHIRWPC